MKIDNFDRQSWSPIPVVLSNLEKFLADKPSVKIVDQLDSLLLELFELRNPKYRFGGDYKSEFQKFKKVFSKNYADHSGWFYFPWSNYLINYLPEKEHQELRTGRNRNLITAVEQEKYYQSCVGILGMSVGSHVAMTVAMTGGAKFLRIADLDVISGSNLNRIRSGFSCIGVSKVKVVARQIFEINPYAQIEIFPEGINEKNISDFVNGKKNKKVINILIEEMDNPFLKIKVREFVKPLSIPVIMAADNGDGVVVDVERFDLEKNYPILHDIIPGIKSDIFKNVKPQELPQVIAKMAGAKYASARMLESVKEVGKTLFSWPQLGTAATLCGSSLSNLARRILIGEKIKSGRYLIDEKKMFKKAK